MKKSIFFAFAALFFCTSLHAQLENKGWWTRDLVTYHYLHNPGSEGFGDWERSYHRFFTQPEIGYVLNKRTMVGIVTQFERVTDRYTIPADQSGISLTSKVFYGAGPLLRFYFPVSKRIFLMPELFAFYSHEKREDTFSSFGLETVTRNAYGTFGAGAFPSFVCFLNRDLAFSITVMKVQYYGNRGGQSFSLEINPQSWLLGVEYYFEKRKKVEEGG